MQNLGSLPPKKKNAKFLVLVGLLSEKTQVYFCPPFCTFFKPHWPSQPIVQSKPNPSHENATKRDHQRWGYRTMEGFEWTWTITNEMNNGIAIFWKWGGPSSICICFEMAFAPSALRPCVCKCIADDKWDTFPVLDNLNFRNIFSLFWDNLWIWNSFWIWEIFELGTWKSETFSRFPYIILHMSLIQCI